MRSIIFGILMFFIGQAVVLQPFPSDPFMVGALSKIEKAQPPVKKIELKYQTVVSSWYGKPYDGRKAANGSTFHKGEMTVASRTLRFGTRLLITNPVNGKFVIARVTDRGPFVEGRDLDVSEAIAAKLGFLKKGVTRLTIAKLNEDSILPILNNLAPQSISHGLMNESKSYIRHSGLSHSSTKHLVERSNVGNFHAEHYPYYRRF